jgi:hypothetical protein
MLLEAAEKFLSLPLGSCTMTSLRPKFSGPSIFLTHRLVATPNHDPESVSCCKLVIQVRLSSCVV